MSKDCDGKNPADRRTEIRIERGTPSDDELAALLAAALLRTSAATPASTPAPAAGASAWVRSGRPGATTAALPADRGPHAWRTSALPR